ncbi:MAG: glutamine--fructose-6-phosphate transaminase (isomerizing), partial [Gammaproteobacteria bacterium]
MCGIVGAIADRDIVPILMEGLRRLEYRGYDSTGVAVVGGTGKLTLQRAVGKVASLQKLLDAAPHGGSLGLAHSRWATHGGVTEANAHPHVSCGRIAVIHNGIIENYAAIKSELTAGGYDFTSETDSEVIGHLVHSFVVQGLDLREAVQAAVARFHGAYAIVVIDAEQPDRVVAARIASPLVVGLGEGENFVASDVQALLPVTRRFQFLEEGDVADVRREGVRVFDASGAEVERPVHESSLSADAVERGEYAHYMLKEIYEQPRAIADTLSERMVDGKVLEAILGPRAAEILPKIQQLHIVACGTSWHAGMVARYAFEEIARVPCSVEIASEYRYRKPVVPAGTLFLAISQSGETADTLAAMREAGKLGYLATAVICNVPESSLVREAELVLMTRAGPEIGVASTKAFTTQLA